MIFEIFFIMVCAVLSNVTHTQQPFDVRVPLVPLSSRVIVLKGAYSDDLTTVFFCRFLHGKLNKWVACSVSYDTAKRLYSGVYTQKLNNKKTINRELEPEDAEQYYVALCSQAKIQESCNPPLALCKSSTMNDDQTAPHNALAKK